MAGKPLYRYMITCDGCEATVGENAEYANAAVAREAAARLGWALIPKLRANGKPGRIDTTGRRVAMQYAHDVCPACQPTFQPEQMTPRGGGTYVRELQEENRRLRAELSRRGGQA